jgi:Ca2+-binding RTX toxin-like protein
MNADLSYFMARYLQDDVFQMYQYFVQGGSTFNGSSDSSGPESDWGGDDIETGEGNDTIFGRGGGDYIKDRGGADTYIGGKGRDTVTYDQWFWNPVGAKSGIVADLAKGTIKGPDGFVDTVKSIEDVRGTQFKDTILGTDGDNSFMGYQGRDLLDGRKGFDTVSYRRDADRGGYDGIEADLSAGTVRDGFGQRDTLRSIEGVEGTNTDDTFVDNAKGNFFRGRDGDDTYTLSRGDDYIDDRDGGADVFRFVGTNIGYNTIEGFDQDGGERDRIFIEGVDDLGDLNIFQDGDSAIIEAASGTIALRDFNAANLSAADFQFDIA